MALGVMKPLELEKEILTKLRDIFVGKTYIEAKKYIDDLSLKYKVVVTSINTGYIITGEYSIILYVDNECLLKRPDVTRDFIIKDENAIIRNIYYSAYY